MHTLILILTGCAILLLFLVAARLLKKPFRRLLPAYLIVWFLGAGINLWIGVKHAGYSFMEELPVFLIVFGVPSLIAWLLARKAY